MTEQRCGTCRHWREWFAGAETGECAAVNTANYYAYTHMTATQMKLVNTGARATGLDPLPRWRP